MENSIWLERVLRGMNKVEIPGNQSMEFPFFDGKIAFLHRVKIAFVLIRQVVYLSNLILR